MTIRLFRCPKCFTIKGYTEDQMEAFDQIVCSSADLDNQGISICMGIMQQLKEHPFFVGQPIYVL